MAKIYILCVEDEPEVLDAIVRDLAPLEKMFPIEAARSAEEARMVIEEILSRGEKIGVILCDHVMPGDSGVELLVELQRNPATARTRKVLLTGQAGLEPTVRAVNEAELKHYIAKPWTQEELIAVSKRELTEYVIENEKELIPYMELLDVARISEELRRRGEADR